MSILKKIFGKKIVFSHDPEITEVAKSTPIKESHIEPLWKSPHTSENAKKDIANNIDYQKVTIFFKDGEIIDVVPDVNNYYKAIHYNIDGTDFDITDIESVNKIPLPTTKARNHLSLGTPVYRLEYLLRIHAGMLRDAGVNTDLSYALMDKGTAMLAFSNLDWQRHDYLREYFWLLDDDRIEEADVFFKKISTVLPKPYSDKEYTKEVQHRKYALLKRNFKQDVPKSFSAYMRMFNKKDEKFQHLVDLAHSINIELNQ